LFTRPIGQPLPHTHPHLMKSGELLPGFQREEFKQRRDEFMKGMPEDCVVLIPGRPVQMHNICIPYKFRQDTELLYLTGYQEPSCVALFEKNNSNYTFKMGVQNKTSGSHPFDGPTAGADVMNELFGCDEAFPLSDISKIVPPLFEKHDNIYYNNKNRWLSLNSHVQLFTVLQRVKPLDNLLSQHRVIKSPAEIYMMKRSADIAAESIKETMRITKDGMGEWELAAQLEYGFKKAGAQHLAFPCVVGCGINACTIHYIQNTGLLKAGELVLVDSGCEYNGYCSDITRTWPVNGRFTRAQRELYDVVLATNRRCIDLCRVNHNMNFVLLHRLAEEMICEGLLKLGILSGMTAQEAAKKEAHQKFFPHSIGHFIGMDTHDAIEMKDDAPFLPGMAVTVEPGLYIPDDPSIPPQYRGIGIRIEDDILITESSPVVLTAATPKDPDEIESIMNH